MKNLLLTISILCSLAAQPGHADTVAQLLERYTAGGAGEFSAARGGTLWQQAVNPRAGKPESCATCHTADVTRVGKHFRTGKSIAALAPSVTPERLTHPAKIEKWFLRNCKGTWGRECTGQEKGDFLMFINQ